MRGSDRRKRPIEFSTPPCFLPRAVRIAEERLDAERHVELVVFGELVSIVEADSSTQTLWQFAELTSDGPGGRNSFSIGRTANHAEAALSFVKNHQPLTTSGEHHEVGLPMARRLAIVDLSRPLGDRAPVFYQARGAAAPSPAPSYFLVTRQKTVPVILLGRPMIDKTID